MNAIQDGMKVMQTGQDKFEYQVCYGVSDRITFANGIWLGKDIPESQRKAEDILACPLMWDALAKLGSEGWELISVLESPAAKGSAVRTYFLKRKM